MFCIKSARIHIQVTFMKSIGPAVIRRMTSASAIQIPPPATPTPTPTMVPK